MGVGAAGDQLPGNHEHDFSDIRACVEVARACVFVILRHNGSADYFVAAAAGFDENFALEDKTAGALCTDINGFNQ